MAYVIRSSITAQKWRISAAALCISLALVTTACAPEPKRIVEHIPIPPERMDCQPAGTRPSIPPEHIIVWENVRSVLDAKAEHDKYVGSVRTREGVVAGYVLSIEGLMFQCSTDAQWLRDWQKGIEQP